MTIRRHDLVPHGGRVLVGLSGGPDSVALVHLLLELQRQDELSVVALAHFNHHLRAEAADDDERFCRSFAAGLSLPLEVGHADVRAVAAAERRSVEDAARMVRYAFLEQAATRAGADAIAVGHTRDDQAETFLLRLIRGAGPRGLAGIHPRAGRVVRPLIDITRAELRAYTAERQLAFCEDATNQDLRIPRNRVRHELLPYLEREFSPNVVDVLAREASIAREDEDRLQGESIELVGSIVLEGNATDNGLLELDAAALASLHPALASRVAREILARAAPGRFVGFRHVTRLLELARDGGPCEALSLPGVQAVRRGERIVLGRTLRRPFSNSFRFLLSIPGEVLLDTEGWAVSASPVRDLSGGAQSSDAGLPGARNPHDGQTAGRERQADWEVAVRGDLLKLPLVVRSRRPGDRFRPAGMTGRKKLQDFLVDRKVPREKRDSLPLVVDGEDRIVWVVGHAVSADFGVTAASQGVILLKARRLGGLG